MQHRKSHPHGKLDVSSKCYFEQKTWCFLQDKAPLRSEGTLQDASQQAANVCLPACLQAMRFTLATLALGATVPSRLATSGREWCPVLPCQDAQW